MRYKSSARCAPGSSAASRSSIRELGADLEVGPALQIAPHGVEVAVQPLEGELRGGRRRASSSGPFARNSSTQNAVKSASEPSMPQFRGAPPGRPRDRSAPPAHPQLSSGDPSSRRRPLPATEAAGDGAAAREATADGWDWDWQDSMAGRHQQKAIVRIRFRIGALRGAARAGGADPKEARPRDPGRARRAQRSATPPPQPRRSRSSRARAWRAAACASHARRQRGSARYSWLRTWPRRRGR